MTKISIIIPVYNVEKYLDRCLNSAVNQTLKDIEIICINGGSSDKTPEILKNYSDKDNRIIIINQENLGISVARNTGIKRANGEFIAFLDSDDWIDIDYYEKLYESAIKNNADIAVSGIIKTSIKYKRPILTYNEEKIAEEYEEKLEICNIPDMCYVWNKIYKRESFLAAGIEFVPGMVYEDMIFTSHILYYMKKLVTVPNTNYYYFRHKNSLVKQKNKKAQEDYNYSKKTMLEFLKNHNIDISKYATTTKRYKIFGITILKTITKAENKKHVLLGFIKW